MLYKFNRIYVFIVYNIFIIICFIFIITEFNYQSLFTPVLLFQGYYRYHKKKTN